MVFFVTWLCVQTMVTVEKDKSDITLLPGGALVNLLELNVIIFADESLLERL